MPAAWQGRIVDHIVLVEPVAPLSNARTAIVNGLVTDRQVALPFHWGCVINEDSIQACYPMPLFVVEMIEGNAMQLLCSRFSRLYWGSTRVRSKVLISITLLVICASLGLYQFDCY